MRTLIVYGSKYGSTGQVAERMARVLEEAGGNVDIVQLPTGSIGLQDYGTVIVGSAIFMGSWTKEALAFLDGNKADLSRKKLGLFVCCGDMVSEERRIGVEDRYMKEVLAVRPELEPMVAEVFGGLIDLKKYGPIKRKLMKVILSKGGISEERMSKPIDARDWMAIEGFARRLA